MSCAEEDAWVGASLSCTSSSSSRQAPTVREPACPSTCTASPPGRAPRRTALRMAEGPTTSLPSRSVGLYGLDCWPDVSLVLLHEYLVLLHEYDAVGQAAGSEEPVHTAP